MGFIFDATLGEGVCQPQLEPIREPAGLTAHEHPSRRKMMDTSDYISIVGVVAILAFLWNLHRDVADLRERMARLEGLFEGFMRTRENSQTS